MTEVVVHSDESFESALRRFKRKCQFDGVLTEIRKREFYERPAVKRKKKEAAAARKLRRRLQREDLL
jgi:small subunit ribosomal protein S21